MKLFAYLKEKKVSFILLAVSTLLAIVGLSMYFASMSIMNARISVWVPLTAIIGILMFAVVLVLNDYVGFMTIVATALEFVAFGLFISSQLGNLGYYFAGIHDIGFGIMPTFVVGAILYLVSIILSSITIFIKK